jgi:hypothetical protein
MKRIYFAWSLIYWCAQHVDIFLRPKTNKKLKIVTASDFSHQNSLNNLLESVLRYEPDVEVVIYDLGITKDFLEKLTGQYKAFTFKTFPWSEYPDFMNIKKDAGHYAWKPAIIKRELSKDVELLLWMDAGNLITGKLTFLRKVLTKYGFYSPYSIGTVEEWTYPRTLEEFGFESRLFQERNLAANVVSVDNKSTSGASIMKNWFDASEVERLIAPIGSNRSNHRQDQSILTLSYYSNLNVRYGSLGEFPRRIFKILVHQDVD